MGPVKQAVGVPVEHKPARTVEVKVAFDGAAPVSVKPEATRAVFKPPPGAKAVTSVEIAFGPVDAPVTYSWK